jgi:hypothetical protein
MGFLAFDEQRSRAILLRRERHAKQGDASMRLHLFGDRRSRLRLVRAMSGGGVTPALQRCAETLQRRYCPS